jgi:hypothetical protein
VISAFCTVHVAVQRGGINLPTGGHRGRRLRRHPPGIARGHCEISQGLERNDLDILHQAMTDAAASLREVLERIAAECSLSYDEMCVIAMMAVSSMAEDALPGTRSRLASYAALIDPQDASPC